MELLETEKAYMAGIIDGDGSISMSKQTSKYGRTDYRCAIKIQMDNREAIDYFHERIDEGYAYKFFDKSRHKPRYVFMWNLNGKNTQEFCELLLPYLLVKKNQALAIIKYYKNGIHEKRILDNELIRREKLYKRVRKLNGSEI